MSASERERGEEGEWQQNRSSCAGKESRVGRECGPQVGASMSKGWPGFVSGCEWQERPCVVCGGEMVRGSRFGQIRLARHGLPSVGLVQGVERWMVSGRQGALRSASQCGHLGRSPKDDGAGGSQYGGERDARAGGSGCSVVADGMAGEQQRGGLGHGR